MLNDASDTALHVKHRTPSYCILFNNLSVNSQLKGLEETLFFAMFACCGQTQKTVDSAYVSFLAKTGTKGLHQTEEIQETFRKG